MFYANGGGRCFIISVGLYPASAVGIKSDDIANGLAELEKEDEPTIILLPDAVSVDKGPYALQQTALGQCATLKDRVAICDLVKTTDFVAFDKEIANFRTSIGINDLKYGAAYGPWINANIQRQIWRRNLSLKRDGIGTDIQLESLTTDADILNLIRDIKLVEQASTSVINGVTAITGSADKTLDDSLQAALDAYRATNDASTAAQLVTALQQFTGLTLSVLQAIQSLNEQPDVAGSKFEIKKTIASYLKGSTLNNSITTLVSHSVLQGANAAAKTAAQKAADDAKTAADDAKTAADKAKTDADADPANAGLAVDAKAKADAKIAADQVKADADAYLAAITISSAAPIANVVQTGATLDATAKLLGFADGATLLKDVSQKAAVTAQYPATVDSLKKRADVIEGAAYFALTDALQMISSIQSSINEFEKSLNDTLLAAFGKFKELVNKGGEALNQLPPSGAVAGIYAKTDNERGVWKAPANVSLNAVISPMVKVSQTQQGAYNVDVNAGKSINIIRAFPGKGTLVWGARTLAGNDNEWRYVPVRRLFNFIEESVKKATEQFVFEPNDANTWVKMQSMIENFLTTLWRQGALQGVKPEHAFYVAVGLGKTMTALDILEGRMNLEIGLVAVRPAEFIILKFSHKMAES
ncbi:phage tail protein [Spirosoma sp. HMF4905]|uniref:Phage tail protein n=2 Tax=Spirosoma arboris TaxID=2682092 RepID=A0A7K1SI48_9BACT|nr:phage tail protein [Spirosoma arboris]